MKRGYQESSSSGSLRPPQSKIRHNPEDFVEGIVDMIERVMLGAKDYVALFFFF
ncbi:unnamed protein product [Camellia sinensis]